MLKAIEIAITNLFRIYPRSSALVVILVLKANAVRVLSIFERANSSFYISGYDGFVAHTSFFGTKRDDEQVQRPQLGMLQGINMLHQVFRADRPQEMERKWLPPACPGCLSQAIHADQLEVNRINSLQPDLEICVQVGDEIVLRYIF